MFNIIFLNIPHMTFKGQSKDNKTQKKLSNKKMRFIAILEII